MDHDNQGVLATLRPTHSRRVMGLCALVGAGLTLIYVAFTLDGNFILQAAAAVAGLVALWGAQIVWHSTASAVELTAEGLRDTDGTVIVLIEDIAVVDRGVFAFKPSNGFTIRLRKRGTTRWRMGLWWRMGRRIGVGGMTPAHHGKLMAERLAMLVNKDGPQG